MEKYSIANREATRQSHFQRFRIISMEQSVGECLLDKVGLVLVIERLSERVKPIRSLSPFEAVRSECLWSRAIMSIRACAGSERVRDQRSERVRDSSPYGIRASTGSERVRDSSPYGIRASTGSERARDQSEHGIRSYTGSDRARLQILYGL